MATSKLRSLLLVLCLTHSAVSFQWTSDIGNDATRFVCGGHNLVLPWNFTSTNETTYTILMWYYRGLSEEVIATMIHGHFVTSSAFSGRVEFLPRAGIILKNVIPGDSGNYSVEVVSHAGETERQNAFVEISDAPSTSSGDLTLQQDMTAVHNDTTGEWSVQLTCGHFASVGQPSFDVVWTTPTGATQPSTNYNGGNFHLVLPNPVRGGKYSCAIDPQSPATSCLPGSSPLLRKAFVNVDEVIASFTLTEARQADFLARYQHLMETNNKLTAGNQHLIETVTNLTETNANLTKYIHYLEDKDANLTSLIHRLEESACSGLAYTVLSDAWRATTNANTSTTHCDEHLHAGWYRFKLNGADAVMPTSCVQVDPYYHCGTYAPAWLDLQGQSLPGVGQEVRARSCDSWDGNCCHVGNSKPVTMRNCGTFYVYNLQPVACNIAYCTTSLLT